MLYNNRVMSLLSKKIATINFQDKHFIGTIAFKSEEISLPNGSKIALGIDDGHWVLIHQPAAEQHIKVYKYDQHEHKIMVDQKAGSQKDIAEFSGLVNYFFTHARTEDLVTYLPPHS